MYLKSEFLYITFANKWETSEKFQMGSKIRKDHMIDQNNRELCNAGS